MFSINNKLKTIVAAVLLICAVVVWLSYNGFNERHTQLSVKPPSQFSNIKLQPIDSTLGLHTTLPYSTLQKAAEQATRETQTGSGERQTCKRILGAKACATVQWQYVIQRSGPISFESNVSAVRLSLPLSLTGTAGIDGRGGKLFGLRNKKFDGLIEINADLNLQIDRNWCPIIKSNLSHQWISDPRIQLAGKFKINLRKSADKAIAKKLKDLEHKLSALIDCEELRDSVQQVWKVHHLPVKLPGQQQSYLELIPRSVAVSPAKPHDDHISIDLELTATTEVVATKKNLTTLPLPEVLSQVTQPGAVEFSLLLNMSYEQIKLLVSKKLVGNLKGINDDRFTITSFDLYPSGQRLIFDLGFTSAGIGHFFKSSGQIYISARPVADPETNQLRLEDLQFTRIIDSEFWSVLSTVLHQRILDTLKEAAVIDLAPQVTKLEQSIITTLSDPQKTANIILDATPPVVRLVTVNPQADALAAIIHVSTRLDATIPPDSMIRQ